MTAPTPAGDDPIKADVLVMRLSPFALEVTRDEPGKPWRRAIGVYGKRRDAEKAAAVERAAGGGG